MLGGSRGAISSRVGLLASTQNLIGGEWHEQGFEGIEVEVEVERRPAHNGRIEEGSSTATGSDCARALLLELSLLLCGPHIVLGVKESVEAGLDVGPPKISRLLAVSIKSNWTYILVVLIMASTLGEELSLLMSRSTPAEGLSAGRTVPTWLGLSIGGMI